MIEVFKKLSPNSSKFVEKIMNPYIEIKLTECIL